MANVPSAGIEFSGANDADDKAPGLFGKQKLLKALFPWPTIRYPMGSLDIYGFDLTFVVGENGRIVCASVKPAYRATGPALNDARKKFLEEASSWRFEPYVIDGKATPVIETVQVREEELPQAHVAMPAGDPRMVTITQDMRPWLANYTPYHVELHGDGTAIYKSAMADDPLGPQTYRVDAKAVTGLVKLAEAADFWSLRDHYRRSPNADKDDVSFERVNITLGGVTKSLTDYFGDDAGLSAEANHLQTAVMLAANIEFWQTPTLATLEQLKVNGFDFHSKAAGRLLLQMTQKSEVKDDAIQALIMLGAPQDAAGVNIYSQEYQDLLQAALANGRNAIAAQLIASGALLTDGKVDRDKVNWAFSQAVYSGNLAAVEQILAFKPDMTYPDPDDGDVKVSIIRRLGDPIGRDGDRIALARRLLDLGADINAKVSDGTTLLHKVAYDQPFALFLLQHGADVDALDKKDLTPLGATMSEDVALLLLDHHANPRKGKTPAALRFNIKNNHWNKVRAWLESHDYADVLIPQKGDD